MSWIKRNLYFLIGGGVAVALLGLAGFYFFTKWQLNQETLEKLNAAYAEWDGITRLNPNPGNDKIDNIKNAKDQRVVVQAQIQKVYKYFTPIASIPASEEGSAENFVALYRQALRRTIDQLQKDAVTSGVTLPPKYKFTFEAQSTLYNISPGTVERLASQLGDVKTMCNILFRAKINSLDNLRRERVGADDVTGPPSDYLDAAEISVTNELAVLTPYEVTFHCFSAELAGVLAGFGNQPNAFIVKTINVDQGGAPAGTGIPGMPGAMGSVFDPMGRPIGESMVPPPPTAAPTAAPRGGLQTALDEKPLRVTLVVDVVKLLPKK